MHTTFQGSTGQTNAIEMIQSLSYHGEPLTIAIPFKGLMLSQDVRLLHVGEDYAVLQSPNQRICAGLRERVFIHSVTMPQKITARIDEINPQRGWIVVSDLITSTNRWLDRKSDRVQPSQPIRVEFTGGQASCLGHLDNLSINGIGILVYKYEEHPVKAKVGSQIHVAFRLPNEKQTIKLSGKIANFHFISQILSKVGVETNLSIRQELLLKQYIHNRKMSILSEMENNWVLVQEPRSTKDLFF